MLLAYLICASSMHVSKTPSRIPLAKLIVALSSSPIRLAIDRHIFFRDPSRFLTLNVELNPPQNPTPVTHPLAPFAPDPVDVANPTSWPANMSAPTTQQPVLKLRGVDLVSFRSASSVAAEPTASGTEAKKPLVVDESVSSAESASTQKTEDNQDSDIPVISVNDFPGSGKWEYCGVLSVDIGCSHDTAMLRHPCHKRALLCISI